MQNPTSTVSSVGIAPMLAAAIGAGLLIWTTAWMGLGIALTGGLLALAAGASYWERLAIRAALDQAAAERAATIAKPDIMPYTQSLHEVADASMARWSKHIDIARLQTESAGSELTHDFDSILTKLRQMLDTHDSDSAQGVVAVIEQSRGELAGMLERLNQAFDAQKPMLEEFVSLEVVTADLKRMANGVGDIAKQTKSPTPMPGLVMIDTAPAARACSVVSAPLVVSDEQITTGVGRSAISWPRKVSPSMRGISTSSVTTSGQSLRIFSMAKIGSGAVPIT
jgi:methyl-accepting chemotaxis protein